MHSTVASLLLLYTNLYVQNRCDLQYLFLVTSEMCFVVLLNNLGFHRRPNATDWSDHEEVIRIDVYQRVMETWSDWIYKNVDPAKQMVFFMSISPLHIK